MKKKGIKVICSVTVILLSCLVFLAGCLGNNTPAKYTIQYADDGGTHQITVSEGMPYSLEVIPTRNGYEFLGLYDSESGGIQYVSASGASLAPFTDGKNIVLFPQFKPKEYTVVLDYQGAAVMDSRQFTVAYGNSLPELPVNLTLEHSVFSGWYTKRNCEGIQIADKYGLIPAVSVLNDVNFELNGEYVYLYAGFETEKHTVTFYFDAGRDSEQIQVPYNTPINEVITTTRINGNAVLTWSKTFGGEVFAGKITENTVLYALEYAPVIEFDSNGGSSVNLIIARSGTTVALPEPTKNLSKFLYWEDMSGEKYISNTMPSKSITLKAVWQAKLVFDENGGFEVNDISVAAGNKITLPVPEREGYIFAGWYTAEKEQYTSTTMPSAGVELKAGWYKEKTETKVLLSGTDSIKCTSNKDTFVDKLTMDFSNFLPFDFNGIIKLNVKWKEKDTGAMAVGFYSKRMVSDDYRIARTYYDHNESSYINMEKNIITELNGNKVYVTIACSANGGLGAYWYNGVVSDFRYTIIYPDTASLYI